MKKGFTLLELLIVIGILAILATTVVLVINPAELLRKARDSQRISDLNSVKTAIGYYMTEATSTLSIGVVDMTYSDNADGLVACDGHASSTQQGVYTVAGDGWIPINFSGLAGGSPIASLPRDPAQTVSTANPGHYYVYLVKSATDYTYELVANLESTYYKSSGDGDKESTDGGSHDTLYEVGTDLTTLSTTSANCYAGGGA